MTLWVALALFVTPFGVLKWPRDTEAASRRQRDPRRLECPNAARMLRVLRIEYFKILEKWGPVTPYMSKGTVADFYVCF